MANQEFEELVAEKKAHMEKQIATEKEAVKRTVKMVR